MLKIHHELQIRSGYRLQWEKKQSSWVLLFPEGMIQLNDTAGMILQQFTDKTSIENAISALQPKFPGENITDDILAFLEDVYEQRWLEQP